MFRPLKNKENHIKIHTTRHGDAVSVFNMCHLESSKSYNSWHVNTKVTTRKNCKFRYEDILTKLAIHQVQRPRKYDESGNESWENSV